MTSKHSLLSSKRQQSLDTLRKAVKHHRGVGQARSAAVRATSRLLALEVAAASEAKARARRAETARQRRAVQDSADLFQGLHA
ncbi:hypothetical protein GGR34_003732 [Microvirga flocculans]|uniref:Uncharacterized protein n=1 Tax=Microvirga flocculans TaxID=217168 RepID=A0A7W6N9S6_9HYPH|nr:hypothetical protein [Microvirga flocculans]MBB4042047.1 hypothetical protein [Microvirga flocculans]